MGDVKSYPAKRTKKKLLQEMKMDILRNKSLWEQIWESQNKKCAICDRVTTLRNTAKSSYSLKIICKECYSHPESHTIIILDEFANYR